MEKVIIIERPISEVFEYVAVCDNSKDYLGSAFNFRATTPPPFGVGTKATAVGNYMGISIRLDYTMVDYVPNKVMRLVSKNQNLNGISVDSEACWRFLEKGPNRTAVSFRLDIEPRDLSKFGPFGAMMAAPIISAAQSCVGGVLDKSLQRLKYTLEKGRVAAA